eukprot:3047345-Ditylum_brightwellii.AAC.1
MLDAMLNALLDDPPNSPFNLQPYFFSESLEGSDIFAATMDDSNGSDGESSSNNTNEMDYDDVAHGSSFTAAPNLQNEEQN